MRESDEKEGKGKMLSLKDRIKGRVNIYCYSKYGILWLTL